MKKYWLFKSEPSCYSIDNFARDKKTWWTGVRNYQARNFLQSMEKGDEVLFYHSGGTPGEPTAIVGLARISAKAVADRTAQDKKDEHFDPKSTPDKPIWYAPEVTFVRKFKNPLLLSDIKFRPDLSDMVVAQRGSRLSVQPVSATHFERIMELVK